MKSSQGWRSHIISHFMFIAIVCFGVLFLVSACIFQPSQVTSMPTANLPTPTNKPTDTPITSTPIPKITATRIPTVSQICTETKGKIVTGEFDSQLLERIFNFQVYLPPCFDASAELRYPVVYLLHGLYTDETQWNLIGLPDAMDAFIKENGKPFIVVMPRIPDNDTQLKSPILQVLPEELVPYIDKVYPTLTDREHRSIGGISRGASLALRIGYDRRNLFGKIGMHSLPMLIDESTSYAEGLGKLDAADRPLLFLDSGNDDRDLSMARTFDLELTKLAIPHTWYMFNGYHNEAYWSEHLPIYLEWYAQGW